MAGTSLVQRLLLTIRRATGNGLPLGARLYVAAVTAAGASLFVALVPREYPEPVLVASLLVAAVLLSAFKVRLPLRKGSSTMSMAHAADFTAIILTGADVALITASAGVLVQCTVRVRERQPVYRTAFSVASVIIAVQSAGWAWGVLGGDVSASLASTFFIALSAAALVYFGVSSALVATAIGLTTKVPIGGVWSREFLWSAPAYFLSAIVAAMVALSVYYNTYVLLPLLAAPLYISYRAYQMSVRRLEEEREHARELASLVAKKDGALARAAESEAALEAEKERLALESARLAVTLRTIGDGVVSVDATGRVLLMNEGALRIASGARDQDQIPMLKQLLESVGLSPTASQQAIDRVLVDGLPVHLRSEIVAEPHATLVEVVGTPTHDGDGQAWGAVWVLRDVTDTARIEHEQAKAARLESLGVLAGGLAHDFNNILMGIVGNLSLAQGMVHSDEKLLATRLASIAAACARARGVTNQLLTFSKGGAPVKTTAAMSDLVTECTRFTLSGSPVAPQFDISGDLWLADVDAAQIGQVIQNLVLNAVQAMAPRGGVLSVSMRNVELNLDSLPARTSLSPGRYVWLTVHDTGPGIAPEHLDRIFDPYFSTKEKGSGLGLAVCYSIVRAHGGAITVESQVGVGTRFSIYLPASTRAVAQVAEMPPPPARGLRGRVLLMDDDAMVAEVTQEMLESLGYATQTTASGDEAIEQFRTADVRGEPFDTVILDLTVPGGMGGGDALPHIRALRADVRVLATSGYADDPVLARYHEYGFDGVLPKPFTLAELAHALGEPVAAEAAQAVAALPPGALGRRRPPVSH
jgi:signal transduction histidine kinase/ActR/RegA family two-component response regulator